MAITLRLLRSITVLFLAAPLLAAPAPPEELRPRPANLCNERLLLEIVPTLCHVNGTTSSDCQALLQSVATEYSRDQFGCDESILVFRSLVHLTRSNKVSESLSATQHNELPFPEKRQDIFFLWLNPTCSVCKQVVDLVLDYQRHSPMTPSLVLRLLPSGEAVSRYAAERLSNLRRIDPELFAPRLIEILRTLPETTAAVDAHFLDLVKSNADSVTFATVAPELDESVAKAFRNFEAAHTAPVGVFHGHVILADKSGGLAFDPFRSTSNLTLTLCAIQIMEGRTQCR